MEWKLEAPEGSHSASRIAWPNPEESAQESGQPLVSVWAELSCESVAVLKKSCHRDSERAIVMVEKPNRLSEEEVAWKVAGLDAVRRDCLMRAVRNLKLEKKVMLGRMVRGLWQKTAMMLLGDFDLALVDSPDLVCLVV
jgi:hypothetical protein